MKFNKELNKKLNKNFYKRFLQKFFLIIVGLILVACTDDASKKQAEADKNKSTNPDVYEIKASQVETVELDYQVARRNNLQQAYDLPIDVELVLDKSFEDIYRLKFIDNPPKVVFDEIADFKADTPKASGKVLIKHISLRISNDPNVQTLKLEVPKAFVYTLYKNGELEKRGIANHIEHHIKINFKNRDNDSIFETISINKNTATSPKQLIF